MGLISRFAARCESALFGMMRLAIVETVCKSRTQPFVISEAGKDLLIKHAMKRSVLSNIWLAYSGSSKLALMKWPRLS